MSSYFTHLTLQAEHELIKGDMERAYGGGPVVNYDFLPVWDEFEEEEIEEMMEVAQHIKEPILVELSLEQQKKVDMEQVEVEAMESQHESFQRENNMGDEDIQTLVEESQRVKTLELEPLQNLIYNQALSCWILEDPVAEYMGSQFV